MSGLDSFIPATDSGVSTAPAVPALPPVSVNLAMLADPTIARPDARLPANNDRLTIAAPPYARPSTPLLAGLRVVPLAAFAWSGAAGRPRSRGDHVVILRPEDATGAAILHLPRGGEALGAGTIRFVPAGTAFAMTPSAEAVGAVLMIPRDRDAGLATPLPAGPLHGMPLPEDMPTLTSSFAALARGAAAGDAHSHLALIASALGRVVATASEGVAVQPPSRPEAELRGLIDRFSDLALNELGRGRTIADLASTLGTSVAALDRACTSLRGCTALELTYTLRRDRAIALLRQTRLPAQKIATQLGFTSLGHMTRVLVLATGRGPEAFRRGD